MESFGQKLRGAVEGLGLRLEDVARETGFEVQHLEALERGDLDALPDDEFVTAGLREFARLVEVDPDAVVEDYLAERARHRSARATEPEESRPPAPPAVYASPDTFAYDAAYEDPPISDPAPTVPDAQFPLVTDVPAAVPVPSTSPQAGRPWLLALGLAAVALVLAAFLWPRGSAKPDAHLLSIDDMNPPVAATPRGQSTIPESRTLDAPVPELISTASRAEPVLASDPTIARYGVGKGVVAHELVGEAGQFNEGTQVWFWTEVLGAAPGQTIHHVWLHEGREMLAVSLRLGGARWRTQSFKNLSSDSQGDWVVEARSDTGEVLARSTFRCSGRDAS